ncbi:uncharacterized protein LOC110826034 [Carica papaya]|uniref:uncharacterized protein LOC110826034 n=1 Tax=Carica papaya TaxID=3649 RepID=UPI000B8C8396|nr:uncharacterized protein LOC110826034 [Carica papaya]
MPSFFCKTTILHHVKYCFIPLSRSILMHRQHFQFLQNNSSILLAPIKFVSTETNQNSFTVFYLVNSCQFSLRSAISASKYINFKTPDKPDSVLIFLTNHGFSKSQIMNLIKKCPAVLTCNPDNLLSKVQFLQSKGFSVVDIAHIFASNPTLFRRKLKDQIIPYFDLIIDLLHSTEEVIAAVKRFPHILCHGFKAYVAPRVDVLRHNGVPTYKILLFLRFRVETGKGSFDKFKETVEMVKEMGISPLKAQFVLAIVALSAVSKIQWKRKFKLYMKWGLSEEEILSAFGRFPWFMVASENKIMAVMEFVVNEMGFGYSEIIKRPVIVSLSLKNRIIPRVAVVQFLMSKGMIKKKHPCGLTYLELTEKDFLQRFVYSYDEAPELLKVYREKMDSPI